MKNGIVKRAGNIDELIEIIISSINQNSSGTLQVKGEVLSQNNDATGTTLFSIQYNLSKQNGSRISIAELEQCTIRDRDEKYKYQPEDTIKSNLDYIIKKLTERTNSVKTCRINTSLYIKPTSKVYK